MSSLFPFSSFLNSSGKKVAFVATVVILSEVLYRVFQKYKNSKLGEKTTKIICDTVFLSYDTSGCRSHVNHLPCRRPNCPVASARKIVSYIKSATKTLDVCIHLLTFNALVQVIIDLYKRGVDVRIIMDNTADENDASRCMELRKLGVKVRTNSLQTKDQCMMHHKFAIVDRSLLISGSANWTNQAFFGNEENILITNVPQLVDPFVSHYDKMWQKYDSE